MTLRMTVDQRPGYLQVQVSGENSVETVRNYIREVRRACLEHACPTVLIEENLQGPGLGLGEMYEVIREESLDRSPSIRRIALVDINPDHNPEDMKFGETAAMNRGMNFRVFPTVVAAETWIRREVAATPKAART